MTFRGIYVACTHRAPGAGALKVMKWCSHLLLADGAPTDHIFDLSPLPFPHVPVRTPSANCPHETTTATTSNNNNNPEN